MKYVVYYKLFPLFPLLSTEQTYYYKKYAYYQKSGPQLVWRIQNYTFLGIDVLLININPLFNIIFCTKCSGGSGDAFIFFEKVKDCCCGDKWVAVVVKAGK